MSAPHPRTTRSGRGLRILRAAVFAAVCVVLAGAGHTLASRTAVPLWTLGAGFLGALALAAPLTGRTRSLPGTAVLLACGQTALHTLFGLGQHGTSATGSSSALSDAALGAGAGTPVGEAAASGEAAGPSSPSGDDASWNVMSPFIVA